MGVNCYIIMWNCCRIYGCWIGEIKKVNSNL